MPMHIPLRPTTSRRAGRPRLISRPRLTSAVLAGALAFAACGGDDAGRGLASVKGADGDFCRALESFAVSYDDAELTDAKLAAMGRES